MAIKLSKPEEKDYEVSYDDGADAMVPLPKYPDPSNGAKEGPCVVLLSGGVESTAILQWCKDTDWFEPVLAVHNLWTDIHHTSTPVVNENIPRIAEYYDVPLFIHTQNDPLDGYVNEEWGVKQIDRIHSSKHWILTACNIAARYPRIKNFFWGVNGGLTKPGQGGDYHFLPRANQFNHVFDQYTNQMNHPDNGQRLLPPLAHMTKRQLWEMIDDEVKPFVQSCAFPKAFDGKSPCGQCEKCQEWFECAMPLDDNGEVIFDEDIAREYGYIDGDNFVINTNKE